MYNKSYQSLSNKYEMSPIKQLTTKRSKKSLKHNHTQSDIKLYNSTQRSTEKQKIELFNRSVRKSNKKFVSPKKSKQQLKYRLPWGVNEIKLRNYVMDTLKKMQEIRKSNKKKKLEQLKTTILPISKKSQQLQHQKSQVKLTPQRQEKSSSLKHKTQAFEQRLDSLRRTVKKSRDKNIIHKQKSKKSKQNTNQNIFSTINSDKFITLESNEALIIKFKVSRGHLIQIGIKTLKCFEKLIIYLQKGNLNCQSIHQNYQKLQAQTKIQLVSSVRGFDKLLDIYPQLVLKYKTKQDKQVEKIIQIPYSWLHAIEIKNKPYQKKVHLTSIEKNKLVRKTSLGAIKFQKNILNAFLHLFRYQVASQTKGQQHISNWSINGKNYSIKLIINGSNYWLECEGPDQQAQQIITTVHKLLHNLS